MKIARLTETRGKFLVLKELAVLIVCFMAGVVFARTKIFVFAPISIAFVSAVPIFAVLPAAIGSAVGSITMIGSITVTKYMLAVAICTLGRFIMSMLKKDGYIILFSGISVVFAAFLVELYTKISPVNMVLALGEGMFCVAVAYFFDVTFKALKVSLCALCLDFKQITAMVVTAAICLTSVSPYTLFGISVARILAVSLILSAAHYGKEAAGAIAGIAFGASLALLEPSALFLCGGFAMGGLFAGVFSRMGQLVSALAFASVNGLFALISEDTAFAVTVCYEVLFASVLFMLLPSGIKLQLSKFFAPKTAPADMVNPKKMLSSKLFRASKELNNTAEIISKVGSILESKTEDLESVFETVRVTVCKGCALCNYCWESAKAETLSEFINATKLMRTDSGEIFSEDFTERCTRQKRLENTLYSAFYDYITREGTRRHVADVRSALKIQFESVSALLEQMSQEVNRTQSVDYDTATVSEAALKELGLTPVQITAFVDDGGKLNVTAALKDTVVPQKKICEKLSLVCDRQLQTAELTRSEGLSFITLTDKAVYSVDIAVRQHTNSRYSLCGDAFISQTNDKGEFCVFLSDGMGSGTRAAVESTMAVGLMSRLCKAGFEPSLALSLVNSALMFKSSDENLATLDVATIDLYSGKAKFYKAGTPPTFIRRDGGIGTAGCSSMPIGILKDVSFDQSECTLKRGDIIVMVSDGATDNGADWIKSEIRQFEGNAFTLADRILKTAASRITSHEDDITVIALIIK